MLIILPSSKRGEINKHDFTLHSKRYNQGNNKHYCNKYCFFIISFIYLFFGFEKARDLYLSKLRFEKIAKTLGLKELTIIFFEDGQKLKFVFDCNTLDLIHLLFEAERMC